jgi:hypothetical protein
MYVSKKNALEIPFDFKTYMGGRKEKALVDSGAMENFIDYKTVKWLKLGTKKLTPAWPVFNIDGTHNKAGTIDQTIHLYTKLGETEQCLQFFVTDLGKDCMILGYPWLQTFNPDINWTNGKLKGQLSVQTTVSKAQQAKHTALCIHRIAMEDATPEITNLQELQAHIDHVTQSKEIHTSELGEQLCKTMIAQQMAEKTYDPTKVNTEATILEEYLQHKKVFSEKEAARFPPPRPWDHKIKLTTDTPETINGKIYPYRNG